MNKDKVNKDKVNKDKVNRDKVNEDRIDQEPRFIEDDSRTIADMNVEGMPWYIGKKASQNQKQIQKLDLTKEERRAMFRGMVEAMVPIAALAVGLFTAAYLFLYFIWLK